MNTERIGDCYYLSDAKIGACGLFSQIEYLVFTFFDDPINKENQIIEFLINLGYSKTQANIKYHQLIIKLKKQGWLNSLSDNFSPEPITTLYFTITTNCNLNCPYCYQGSLKEKCYISVENAKRTIEGLKAVNYKSHIVLTGGETFMHPKVFDIIDIIELNGFSFSILTNGTLVNSSIAKKLSKYKLLQSIQISIDGIDSNTHKITRGNSFEATMRGIEIISNYHLPFSLGPTIHEGNANQINDIAKLALEKGGWLTPNNLIVTSHNTNSSLSLTNLTLERVMKQVGEYISVHEDKYAINKVFRKKAFDVSCHKQKDNLCGIAFQTLDLNWNGDVYPCNLLRNDKYILGNLFSKGWEFILQNGIKFRNKIKCSNINKCSSCDILNICNGGCRASAFYKYGTFDKEDPLCDLRYSNIKLQILKESETYK